MYRSEQTIEPVVAEAIAEFERLRIANYEIILVNDASPDNVYAVACKLADDNPRITAIDLARNVGQGNATLAGLEHARSDFIVQMDDDMQTPGYEIGKLIDAIIERDDDIVFASYRETEGKRPLIRRIGTKLNWMMAEIATKKPKGIETNSFRIMRRFVAEALLAYNSRKPYSYGVMFECTSRVSNVTVDHRPRAVGKSGFTLRSLADLWFTGLVNFSIKPLRIAAFMGVLLLVASIVGMIIALVIQRFYIGLFWGLALILAIQLLVMGFIGEYVGRIFMAESNLPKYSIRGVTNYKPDSNPSNMQL